MKEKTKKILLGKWLYAIYRRSRYLRYVKKIKKERRKIRQYELKQEAIELKTNLKAHSLTNRNSEKKLKRLRKQEAKNEQKNIRKSMKAKAREDRILAKQARKRELKEKRILRDEMKKNLKSSSISEKQELMRIKKLRKQEARARKRRMRKVIKPYLRKRRRRARIQSIRNIDWQTVLRWLNWYRAFRENRTERSNFMKIMLNSSFLFMLSYLLLFLIGQSLITFVAYTYEYKTIIFYYKIYYDIDSAQWTGDAVKILFSIQPIVGLILGTIGLIIFSSKRNEAGTFKLFYLWTFVNGMIMFFGSLLIGTLLNQGFGWVISYLYFKDTGKMIFSIISIFALGSLGTAVSRSFLLSGNSYYNFISSDNRKSLLLSQVMLPAFLGSAALSILKFPIEYYYTTSEEVIYEVLKLATFILIVLPVFLSFSSFTDTYFDEEPRKIRIKFWYILVTLVIFGLMFYFFKDGVALDPPEVNN